ncbi:Selenocysteine insertion sequence-binding protein 2 [Cichlidogyrus casuarinus]|uniref:Selenocysteine insertion sequence-binding protein 2 n=1 Tax=Cichlidogyrus casuarinus TaxID=1844966 RepID=A0ABD2PWG8_9PLAT
MYEEARALVMVTIFVGLVKKIWKVDLKTVEGLINLLSRSAHKELAKKYLKNRKKVERSLSKNEPYFSWHDGESENGQDEGQGQGQDEGQGQGQDEGQGQGQDEGQGQDLNEQEKSKKDTGKGKKDTGNGNDPDESENGLDFTKFLIEFYGGTKTTPKGTHIQKVFHPDISIYKNDKILDYKEGELKYILPVELGQNQGFKNAADANSFLKRDRLVMRLRAVISLYLLRFGVWLDYKAYTVPSTIELRSMLEDDLQDETKSDALLKLFVRILGCMCICGMLGLAKIVVYLICKEEHQKFNFSRLLTPGYKRVLLGLIDHYAGKDEWESKARDGFRREQGESSTSDCRYAIDQLVDKQKPKVAPMVMNAPLIKDRASYKIIVAYTRADLKEEETYNYNQIFKAFEIKQRASETVGSFHRYAFKWVLPSSQDKDVKKILRENHDLQRKYWKVLHVAFKFIGLTFSEFDGFNCDNQKISISAETILAVIEACQGPDKGSRSKYKFAE